MQHKKNKEAAVVVFSGGQDSTTCLLYAKKHYKKVYAVSFDYHQDMWQSLMQRRKSVRSWMWSRQSWI